MDCPAESDADLLAALRLNLIPGVGPRTQQSLLARFGTAQGVFDASPGDLRAVEGIGPKLAAAICAARNSGDAEHELRRCRELGIRLVPRGVPEYPRSLAEICDPPTILYCRGEWRPCDNLAVSIVGSRRCTLYGRQQAERLGASLARAGLTIISGLARGIDAAAHEGALSAGGRTVAVLGTGICNIYPPEHKELAARVVQQGVLMSEVPLDQAPLPGLFPQRNRIISGMSAGVIVVEATRSSGALHTVRHAMEQGREVFAVPGRIDSFASEGCHDIIRDGATLVRNVDDVLTALGPLVAPVKKDDSQTVHSPRELTLSGQELEILNLVTIDPIPVDEILRLAGIESARVLTTLTILEMKRMVRRLPGGNMCRI